MEDWVGMGPGVSLFYACHVGESSVHFISQLARWTQGRDGDRDFEEFSAIVAGHPQQPATVGICLFSASRPTS